MVVFLFLASSTWLLQYGHISMKKKRKKIKGLRLARLRLLLERLLR